MEVEEIGNGEEVANVHNMLIIPHGFLLYSSSSFTPFSLFFFFFPIITTTTSLRLEEPLHYVTTIVATPPSHINSLHSLKSGAFRIKLHGICLTNIRLDICQYLPQLDGASKSLDFNKLWKPPPNRSFVACVEPSSAYMVPGNTRGYLLVNTNGGLNQMRAGICDMVAVARIINATLVVPELDKLSFWQDASNFSDVFDEDHFINSLANDVRVVKELPNELANATVAVEHFRSWSGLDYYQEDIANMWEDYRVIQAAKSDSRLANNNLPPDIQKLRCRACYEALRFAPRIEAMGKLLVDRMRSYGPYIALHLRYEKDMLAFSGCTHDLSSEEADELRIIRENTSYWKVKEIDSMEQRSKGHCPLTPKEVGIFLNALGYSSNTPIYIAAGEIYGGDSRMADLQSRYPVLMNKEKLASVEELVHLKNYASQMAALDYIVSVESDIFIPTYSGNMARAVEGKGLHGRGKGQFRERRAWIDFARKKHFM
ncbi:hypothetical protein LguiA_004137 [Lonicera macranthoides]